MKKFLIVILLLLNIIVGSAFGYLVYLNHKYIPPTDAQISAFADSIRLSNKFVIEQKLSETYFKQASKEIQSLKLNAWIPWWGMEAGIKSLEAKKDLFDTVSPVLYEMTPDGKIDVKKTGLDKLLEVTKDTQIKVLPTIANFDPSSMSIMLNDDEKLKRHIEFLIKEVDDNNFHGLDLDYEAIFLKDKDKFFYLLKTFSEEMKKRNKMLTVAVLSKWGDEIKYDFLPETRAVQDYAEIAKYVDQLRIMTYDYTSSAGQTPGPIAPIEWMDQVLDYTVKRVPKEKVVMGIHLYGYSWPYGEKSRALDFRQISDLKENNISLDLLFSDKFKEGAIRYTKDGKNHFGYYSSAETLKARLDLAAKYGIHGVAFWRLGDDYL